MVRLLLGVCLCAAWAPIARAQCVDPSRSIRVELVGDAWTEAFGRRVIADLAAAVRTQGFSVCRGGDDARAVAVVRLRALALPRFAVAIRVSDGVTDKRLERDLDLATFPEDARSLALAVAADELLRASWMELAMADAPAPDVPPPAEVLRTVAREVQRAAPRRASAGARASVDAFTGGELLLGGDVVLRRGLEAPVSLALAFGARRGRRARSPRGSVRALALGAEAGVSLEPLRTPRFVTGATASLRVDRVTYDADASAGNVASSRSAFAVTARLTALVAVRLGEALELHLDAGAAFALRGVEAGDPTEPVTGVTGPGGHAALEVAARF